MTRFLAARNAPLSSVKAVVLTITTLTIWVMPNGSGRRRARRCSCTTMTGHAAMRKSRPALYPLWKPPVLHLVGQLPAQWRVPDGGPWPRRRVSPTKKSWMLPGRPRVIPRPATPPETRSLSLADREVLIAGDTLATLSLVPGESGPQLAPSVHERGFTTGPWPRWKRSSRSMLAGSCQVTVFLGGGSPQQAVKLARQIAGTGQVERPAPAR